MAIAGAAVCALSCYPGPSRKITVLPDSELQALEISPKAAEVNSGESIGFRAHGGVPPYQFLVAAGGGYVHPVTGKFLAPEEDGWVVVRVRDSYGKSASSDIRVIHETNPIKRRPPRRGIAGGPGSKQ